MGIYSSPVKRYIIMFLPTFEITATANTRAPNPGDETGNEEAAEGQGQPHG